MIHPLTVIYLHTPCNNDDEMLPKMEYGLSDTFRLFCRDAFSYDEPIDYPRLKLITASTPKELDELLFGVKNDRHFVSDAAKFSCLFLFDDEILIDGTPTPLDKIQVDSLPIFSYFRSYFPATPKVLLTIDEHPKIDIPARRWIAKHRYVLENPEAHSSRLLRMFSYFWQPHFCSALKDYVRTKAGTNWHTPGHNSGNAFEYSPFLHGFHDAFGSMSFRADLSVSVESLGDLSMPDGDTPLSRAQRLSSVIFGTAQTCFVTNGTSTSNKAMLMTLLRPGEVVLIDRNCHKSVHHAVVMSGAIPRYLPASYNSRYGIWGPISLDTLRTEINRKTTPQLKPKMLIITTCTYEGILYPTWEIGRLCEEAGILFYADEAWAPYLNFHPYYTRILPSNTPVRYNAVNEICGAHFAVQSTHKALSAFSQASMIHVSTRFKRLLEEDGSRQFRWLRRRFGIKDHGSYEKFSHDLHEFLRYWHSTSPHYPMLATLDMSATQMRLEGLKIIEERLHYVASFMHRVSQMCNLPEDECFVRLHAITGNGTKWDEDGYMHDPLKMTLSFKNEHCLEKFKKALQKSHIQWEKSTPVTILFLVTVGTVEEHFEYLYRVCVANKECIGKPEVEFRIPSIPAAVSEQASVLPRDAALCDGELVPIQESEGRICGQLIAPYPPGIPVLLPGLRITKPMIELILDVIKTDGPNAVHGLFVRGAKYYIEVLNKDEESKVLSISQLSPQTQQT